MDLDLFLQGTLQAPLETVLEWVYSSMKNPKHSAGYFLNYYLKINADDAAINNNCLSFERCLSSVLGHI